MAGVPASVEPEDGTREIGEAVSRELGDARLPVDMEPGLRTDGMFDGGGMETRR